jgi:hypothetical protein
MRRSIAVKPVRSGRAQPCALRGRCGGGVLFWLLTVLLVFALLAGLAGLLLLPTAARYSLQWWLEKHSSGVARVHDVSVNVLTGELTLHEVELHRNGEALLRVGRLATALDMRLLWRQVFELGELSVQDVFLDLRHAPDGTLLVGGMHYDRFGQNFPGLRAVRLQNVHLRSDLAAFSGDLVLADLRGREIAHDLDAGEVDLGATLQAGRIEVHGRVHTRPDGDPVSAGGVDVSALAGGEGRVRLRMDGPSGRVRFDFDGSLIVDGLHASAGALLYDEHVLSWQGNLNVLWEPGMAAPQFRAQGNLAGLEGRLLLSEQDLGLVQQNLLWAGRLEGRSDADHPLYLWMDADATSGPLRIESARDGALLAQAQDVQWWGITADRSGVAVGEIWLGAVLLHGRTGALEANMSPSEEMAPVTGPSASVAAAVFQGVRLLPGERLSVDQLRLQDLSAAVRRDAAGGWRIPDGLWPALAVAPARSWRLGVAEIAGESYVDVEDHALEPPHVIRLEPLHLLVEGMDTEAPEQATQIYVQSGVGAGAMDLSVSLRPFAGELGLGLNGQLAGLELPLLAPYGTRCTGYSLTGGRLDAELIARIEAGRLWSNARLVTEGLAVEEAVPERTEALAAALGMPLHEALARLRDGAGRITLLLSVGGDVRAAGLDLCAEFGRALVAFLHSPDAPAPADASRTAAQP